MISEIMSKTACKKKKYKVPDNPKYYCKKCGSKAKKEDKVCKPKKIS
jgi:rRNA maturation endonuclease Nob1